MNHQQMANDCFNAALDWNEADHPRAENGEFGSGGGGSKTSPSKATSELVSVYISKPVPFVSSFLKENMTIAGQEKYLESVPTEKLHTGIKLISNHRDQSAASQHVLKLMKKELAKR